MDSALIKTDVIKPFECFKEAWYAIKDQYLLLFAITIVGVMVSGLTLYIMLGAIVCGIFYCFLQVIDGKEANMEALFKSYRYFKPGLIVSLFFVFPLFVIIGLYVPLLWSSLSGKLLSPDEIQSLIVTTLITESIFATITVCLHTLLVFTFPLIADKGLSGFESIKISAKAVWRNLNGIAGLWAIGFLVSLVGLLVFCVGVYLTMPLIIAANTVAYRKIFPAES